MLKVATKQEKALLKFLQNAKTSKTKRFTDFIHLVEFRNEKYLVTTDGHRLHAITPNIDINSDKTIFDTANSFIYPIEDEVLGVPNFNLTLEDRLDREPLYEETLYEDKMFIIGRIIIKSHQLNEAIFYRSDFLDKALNDINTTGVKIKYYEDYIVLYFNVYPYKAFAIIMSTKYDFID